jgi:hypothetical protein
VATLVAVLLIAGCGGSSSKPSPAPQLSSHRVGPQTMFTAGGVSLYTPTLLSSLQALGVDSLHVYMHWADIAPDIHSTHEPDFDANDPGAYPAKGWAPFDALVRQASTRKMGVVVDLVAPSPRWAAAPGASDPATQTEWKPNAAMFKQWVHAVGVRYSGTYRPAGAKSPLPRVDFWSVWNEPNIGVNLAPETTHGGSAVEVAPRLYRGLLNAAWSSLQATGHGNDRILIGELAPAGVTSGATGLFNAMAPLRFLRALYCVDASFHQLRGSPASQRGCPTTTTASADFAQQNPGLFKATGFAVHPYSFTSLAPNVRVPNEPDFAELAALPTFESTLDRLQQAYGSHKKFPIWSTEFGYITNPPNPDYSITPARAALYVNWAEYITWEDPRIKSYDQYLWFDPPSGRFATGLFTAAGKPKPSLYAFQIPLYLPESNAAKGTPLVVWGAVRPGPEVARAIHKQQIALIQFRSGSSSAFNTIDRVPITGRYGYFEVREKFPSSGQVRLAWQVSGQSPTQYSRIADITLR